MQQVSVGDILACNKYRDIDVALFALMLKCSRDKKTGFSIDPSSLKTSSLMLCIPAKFGVSRISPNTPLVHGTYFDFGIASIMGRGCFASHLSKSFISLVWDLMIALAILRRTGSLPC